MLRHILIALVLLTSFAAFAQPPVKLLVATGLEIQTEALSPGTWSCDGGVFTGTMPPCSPGTTRIRVRDISNRHVYQEVTGTAAAYMGGSNVTYVHGDFDANFYGHMWGEFDWYIPEMGGGWEGTFTAMADQARGIVVLKGVGYGRGGKLEGLKIEILDLVLNGKATVTVTVTPKG